MAENKSIFKIKGKLGEFSFFNMTGKNRLKRAPGHPRNRIMNDPAFANVRKNLSEFGGGSSISKAIRLSWGSMGKQFQDSYMASRLTRDCRKLIIQSSGDWGRRKGDLRTHGTHLVGFALDEERVFSHYYHGEFQATFTADRSQCTISNPQLRVEDFRKMAKKATHVQFTAGLSLISNHSWSKVAQKYRPLVPEQNAMGNIQPTEYLPIDQLPTQLQWVLETPKNIIPHPEVACLITVGISYGIARNNQIDSLKKGCAMHILACV